jgi:hypothetical protein
MTLALISASGIGASLVKALATFGTFALTFVSRRCYLVTLTLFSANRLGASLVKAFAAFGTNTFTFVLGGQRVSLAFILASRLLAFNVGALAALRAFTFALMCGRCSNLSPACEEGHISFNRIREIPGEGIRFIGIPSGKLISLSGRIIRLL